MNNLTSKNIMFIFFALYISLILGFFLNEDFALGYVMDHEVHKELLYIFDRDILSGFIDYENKKVPHSPVYVLYINIITKIFNNDTLARLINLHIGLLLPFFLYKSLQLKFKKNINNYLYLFPSIIFLSPYFRSGAIWIDDNLLGLVFLSISIYYFIKYESVKKNLLVTIFFNILFLALASYIRPIYSLFGLYFFVRYFLEIKSIKILIIIILFNLILSWPAIYYVFVLGIDGWFNSYLFRRNIVSVVYLALSVIFFYFLPYLLFYFRNKPINFFDYKYLVLFIVSLILLNLYFSYITPYSGGIFFKSSIYLFNNLMMIYLISSLALVCLVKFFFENKYKKNIFYDFLLLIILLTLEVDGVIYHEAYDPLLYLLIFTIFKNNFLNNFANTMNLRKYLILLLFSSSFYVMSIMKSLI